jgi:hypothetical protein
MKNAQEHPVVNLELERTMLAVVVVASIVLSLKKVCTNIL